MVLVECKMVNSSNNILEEEGSQQVQIATPLIVIICPPTKWCSYSSSSKPSSSVNSMQRYSSSLTRTIIRGRVLISSKLLIRMKIACGEMPKTLPTIQIYRILPNQTSSTRTLPQDRITKILTAITNSPRIIPPTWMITFSVAHSFRHNPWTASLIIGSHSSRPKTRIRRWWWYLFRTCNSMLLLWNRIRLILIRKSFPTMILCIRVATSNSRPEWKTTWAACPISNSLMMMNLETTHHLSL